MEKQLSETNTIIDFLTTQVVANSQDTSKSKCSHNIIERNHINKDKNNDSLHEGKDIENLSNKVVIMSNFMLNNINSPGATSSDVLMKSDDVLNKKLASLMVHVGTNNLTNYVNLL